MFSLNIFSALVFALILSLGATDSDWDYIVFSQSWPSTRCTEWKKGSSSHYCSLPKDNSHWIVHGLWPTKSGSEGPNFCTRVQFNATALSPILGQLDENWTNIEMPTNHTSFWEHEWLKHGSCATSLPILDSELKYFSQGLSLVEKYNIATILSNNNILAGDRPYSSQKIYSSLHSVLKKGPAVHCIHERGTGKIFLSEVRICMNRSFEVIDCEDRSGQQIVNCGKDPREEVVHYPSAVPTLREYSSIPLSPHWLYKALYVLRLLAWFSL